jgi:GT2 family glycosyltransferase
VWSEVIYELSGHFVVDSYFMRRIRVEICPLKILIVVLNWNSCEMTKDCVTSLLAMKGAGFRILVIDNGSRDGSVAFLREAFPEIEVTANGRNLGFAGGCNVGMNRALVENFEHVLLINNDTVVKPNLLAELLAESERSPKAGMVSPRIYYADNPDRVWWAGGAFSLWQGIPRHLGWKGKHDGRHEAACSIDWATGCAVLLNCDALREAGLFDEQFFANSEDLDLSLRMRRLGWEIRYAPAAELLHKEGFATRRNVGEDVRYFTSTRNILWLMHKHAKAYHWITFWPIFTGYYLPKVILSRASRGDFRSCWAVFQGIAAFWKMLLHPGISVLPAVLKATTMPIAASESSIQESVTFPQ